MTSETKIQEQFSFHPPRDGEVAAQHVAVRKACELAALQINNVAPDSPEKCKAIEKLREAAMWANAAIALNQGGR